MLLRAGVEVAHDGLVIIDAEGRVVVCNRAAREILKVLPQEIMGRNLKDLLPESFAFRVLDTEEPLWGEKVSLRGKIFLTNQDPIFSEEQLVGAVVSFQDMTGLDSLALELESMKKLNREWEAIFDSSYDEIFVTDGQGYAVRVNRACERFYGVKTEELIGKHVKELERQGLFSPNVTSQALAEKKRVTSMQNTKGGQKLVVTSNPVFDDAGNIIRVVTNSRDITELSNLKQRLEETEKLVDSYRNKIAELHKERLNFGEDIVYASTPMKDILNIVEKVAAVDSTVLIEGESGVGKGLIAARIHKLSKRASRPFITVNCGAIPETLMESELFGYEAGAFTGARREGKKGLIEMANGGTIFFDEIGDLPLNLQVKLLHVIQEKRMKRIGGTQDVQIDIRIITATNRNLRHLVNENKFREDLFYRLNVIPIVIPPLRHRKEDIRKLVNRFLDVCNARYDMNKRVSPETLTVLEDYNWPGNVREVENLMERLTVTVDGNEILPGHLPEYLYWEQSKKGKVMVLDLCGLKSATEEVEKQLLKKALTQFHNTYKMAEALDVNQSTVVRKMRRYGLFDDSNLKTGKS
ncbi:sigma 54-interacting transcriptional regulator [Candidatus Formimonas warabiya]|uniref:sigma 54-interacting transcriptional regulator n=1 Tax=Formimonas warabiya TaxID=1761012 RepID=UPI0011D04293|nr:sigma 54-interacting transcriptional regulator [Candidatus Formimonas warabiya]